MYELISLTTRQLKMLVGEPVFVVTEKKKEWCIVHSYHSSEVVGGGIIVTTRTSQKKILPYQECGIFWHAYGLDKSLVRGRHEKGVE